MTQQSPESAQSPPAPSSDQGDGTQGVSPHPPENQSSGVKTHEPGADLMDLDDPPPPEEDGTRSEPPEHDATGRSDAPPEVVKPRKNVSAHVKLYGPGALPEDISPAPMQPPPVPPKEHPLPSPAHGEPRGGSAEYEPDAYGDNQAGAGPLQASASGATYGRGLAMISTAKGSLSGLIPSGWSGKGKKLSPVEEATTRFFAISDFAAWEREKSWILHEIQERYRAESDLAVERKEARILQKLYQESQKEKKPSYRDSYNRLVQQYNQLEQRFRHTDAALRGQIADLQKANHSLHQEKENAVLRAKAEFRRREKDQDDRIKALEDINAEQSKKVELAHSAAKAIMDESKTFATSDDDVKSWFSRQTQDWYDWAKDFCHRDPTQISALSPPERHEFYSAVSEFVALEDGELPEEIDGKRKMMYVLLQAMLADFVCKTAFESPFWILDALHTASSVEGLTDGVTAKELTNLYNELIATQERDAHQWRSIMMRIMAVNGMGEPRKGESDQGRRHGAVRRQYSERLTRQFLEGPARFLLHEEAFQRSNCRKRLREGIDKTLQYSAGLWSHRSYVKCLGLEHFQNVGQGCYDSRMQEAEVYQATKLERPNACEGAPIIMVVTPAVIACGTEEGQNYASVWRPWMKAQLVVRLKDY